MCGQETKEKKREISRIAMIWKQTERIWTNKNIIIQMKEIERREKADS